MARTDQSQSFVAAAAGVLTAALVAGTAYAQDAAPPASPAPAPFSQECQGGSTEIVAETPLPHVAAALAKRRTIRILAIGSSAGREGGYTRQIERILRRVHKGSNVVIINRGVSGELSANAAIRIKNEVALTNPDLVIWQVGTDDALAFVPVEELRYTVEKAVRWLKEHNVDVVLAGLQFVRRLSQDEHYYAVREMLREVAAKENVMIIRRYEAMQFIDAAQQADGGLGPDEFERNETGYNCLAQYLASAITIGAFGKGMSTRPLRGQPGQPGQPQQSQQR